MRPDKSAAVPAQAVTGIHRKLVRVLLRTNILWIALSAYRNPITAGIALVRMLKTMKTILGLHNNPKLKKANDRYFWSLTAAGWPSPAFDHFIRNELNKVLPFPSGENHLQTMIFSITSRCPLQCDHCYEWNNLSVDETLSLASLMDIQKKFQAYGICNIQYSGGEPLSRFEDLIRLIKAADADSELWILTSGFGLTRDKACELKAAGLTGVTISLDHWDEELHNRFRKSDKAYFWAMEAARNARQTDLVVAFSLCAGKEFVSKENLSRYLHLAYKAGAALIRILEPRQVGHFEGKNIELDEEQIRILEDFCLQTNSDKSQMDMPIIEYTGYHQRRFGCFGAGDRYLYIDSKGDIHACPFCQNPAGNALSDPLPQSIARLRQAGCHKFSGTAEG